jgi:hypothetical protein
MLDAQTDEHALDTIDHLDRVDVDLRFAATLGVMHGAFAYLTSELGAEVAESALEQLTAQLAHWRAERLCQA